MQSFYEMLVNNCNRLCFLFLFVSVVCYGVVLLLLWLDGFGTVYGPLLTVRTWILHHP